MIRIASAVASFKTGSVKAVMTEVTLPCSVCEVDSARAPQLDWTSGPRMVTSELPRFISAAFRGATWLNWTAERQPTKP